MVKQFIKWSEIYTQLIKEFGKTGKIAQTKRDVYELITKAPQYLNAEEKIKRMMSEYYVICLNKYKSKQTLEYAVRISTEFIQWYSEKLGRELKIIDLWRPDPGQIERTGTTKVIVLEFCEEYSDKETVHQTLRSYLSAFGIWLDESRYVNSNPFTGLVVRTAGKAPQRTIVYNKDELKEFFDLIFIGLKPYHRLFASIIFHTGIRNNNVYKMKCGDITDRTVTDALGRIFYSIETKKLVEREKKKMGEQITSKVPPEYSYIPEYLYKDIKDFCSNNNLKSNDYIFQSFIAQHSNFQAEVIRRRENPNVNKDLKFMNAHWGAYLLYGLRHTWSSIVFKLGGESGNEFLKKLGGWTEDKTVTTVYVHWMSAKTLIDILNEWQIYIPPELKSRYDALVVESGVEEKSNAPVDWKQQLKSVEDKMRAEADEREERQRKYFEEKFGSKIRDV